jgi:hypothetical protein
MAGSHCFSLQAKGSQMSSGDDFRLGDGERVRKPDFLCDINAAV